MAKQLFKSRNEAVKTYFASLAGKYPEWRLDALEEKTAGHFYISTRTVRAILKGEGNYAN